MFKIVGINEQNTTTSLKGEKDELTQTREAWVTALPSREAGFLPVISPVDIK